MQDDVVLQRDVFRDFLAGAQGDLLPGQGEEEEEETVEGGKGLRS